MELIWLDCRRLRWSAVPLYYFKASLSPSGMISILLLREQPNVLLKISIRLFICNDRSLDRRVASARWTAEGRDGLMVRDTFAAFRNGAQEPLQEKSVRMRSV
jgi:hypothetical protein